MGCLLSCLANDRCESEVDNIYYTYFHNQDPNQTQNQSHSYPIRNNQVSVSRYHPYSSSIPPPYNPEILYENY